MEKVVAFVFAHNEAPIIGHTLDILNKYKRLGVIHEVAVINDGSTDETARIARQKGARVITHKKKSGRAQNFISAAYATKSMQAGVMLYFDADLIELPERTLRRMINTVKGGKKLMAIAQQNEEYSELKNKSKKEKDKLSLTKRFAPISEKHKEACGQRAIHISALEPLFKKNAKWMQYLLKAPFPWHGMNQAFQKDGLRGKAWVLEPALDMLIAQNKAVFLNGAEIYMYTPFRKSTKTHSVKMAEKMGFGIPHLAQMGRSSMAEELKRKRKLERETRKRRVFLRKGF